QVVYDQFEAEEGFFTALSTTPRHLKTLSAPIALRYFAPNGFFAGVATTYVDQEVIRTPDAKAIGLSDGKEDFVLVDASIGWRFPKRFGLASVTVYNLFNEKFRYQDDNFREFRNEPSPAPYFPERRVIARATLYF